MPPDDQYYYDLAHARAKQRELDEVQSEAARILKPPSGMLYFFLYALSAIGDIIDWGDLTGIGAIVSIIVDIFIGAILLLSGRSAKSRTEAMGRFQDELHNKIEQINKKITAYRNSYAKALKVSRKVKFLRKPTRVIAIRFAKLRKSIAKNPYTRTIVAVAADLIPILDLLPWRTINIYFMKRDEMRAYKEAQSILPEYLSAKSDEVEAANDLAEIEAQGAVATE